MEDEIFSIDSNDESEEDIGPNPVGISSTGNEGDSVSNQFPGVAEEESNNEEMEESEEHENESDSDTEGETEAEGVEIVYEEGYENDYGEDDDVSVDDISSSEDEASNIYDLYEGSPAPKRVRTCSENAIQANAATVDDPDVPAAGPSQPGSPAVAPMSCNTSTGSDSPTRTNPSASHVRSTRSIGTSPISKQSRFIALNEDDDDGMICMICLETWETEGYHRLVVLKCGHLFGDSCVRRWLMNTDQRQSEGQLNSCPHCKVTADVSDIRNVYASRVRAVDRTEVVQLQSKLDSQCRQTALLQNKLTDMRTALDCSERERHNTVKKLKIELHQAREQLNHFARMNGNNTLEASGSGASTSNSPIVNTFNDLPLYKLNSIRTVTVQQTAGCRVFTYLPFKDALAISCRNGNQLFPGFGITLLDTNTNTITSKFCFVDKKIIRHMAANQDKHLLSITNHTICAFIFDTRMQHIAHSVINTNNKRFWASVWDSYSKNESLILGTADGRCLRYDLRMPTKHVRDYMSYIEEEPSPVIALESYPHTHMFPGGGLLICNLQSIRFIEYGLDGVPVAFNKLELTGPFMSMCFNIERQSILIQKRAVLLSGLESQFILFYLEKVDSRVQIVNPTYFTGCKKSVVVTRPVQINVEDNILPVGYLQDNKMMTLFDVKRSRAIQQLPVNEIIYDMTVITKDSPVLATLTDTKCRFYDLLKLKINN